MSAKDAKELINDIKRRDYKVIHKKDYDLLLNYINQLEEENKQFQQANVEFVSQNNKLQHRIYEAIEYIKHSWRLKFDQVYDTSKKLSGWEAEELLSILERGKE